MPFRATTQLPLGVLTFLSKLKSRYACGPLLDLDIEQVAMLDAFDALYPAQKYRVVHSATNAGRDYLLGRDLEA